jgi:hypothetical protein
MITFNLIDYKGKHYIIQDKDYIDEYGMDWEVGTITKKEASDPKFIKAHKNLCTYYGIPCYIGKDKELNKIYK